VNDPPPETRYWAGYAGLGTKPAGRWLASEITFVDLAVVVRLRKSENAKLAASDFARA